MRQSASCNTNTLFTGLLGHPVENSLLPDAMNALYRLYGLNYVYESFDVRKNEFPSLLDELKAMGFCGFNVTAPGKAVAAYLCDKLNPTARIVNYADAVLIKDGMLTGYNTKGYAFRHAVEKTGTKIRNSRITIFGCGETALAICSKCALSGASAVFMIAEPSDPRITPAAKLSYKLAAKTNCRISIHDPADIASVEFDLSCSNIVVNASYKGRYPDHNESVIRDPYLLRSDHTVADIVYYPLNTKLLREASAFGCNIVTGIDILLYQAAASLKIFTGLRAREADLQSLLPSLYRRTLCIEESQV